MWETLRNNTKQSCIRIYQYMVYRKTVTLWRQKRPKMLWRWFWLGFLYLPYTSYIPVLYLSYICLISVFWVYCTTYSWGFPQPHHLELFLVPEGSWGFSIIPRVSHWLSWGFIVKCSLGFHCDPCWRFVVTFPEAFLLNVPEAFP